MKSFPPLLAAALALGVLPLLSRAQAPAIPAAPALSPSDPSQYATADALWQHLQDLKKGPKTPPKTAEEYHTFITNMLAQIYAGATAFVKRYPDDPRKWDARLLQIETSAAINRLSGNPDEAASAQQLQDLANQQDAPSSVRGQARYELLGMSLRDYLRGNSSLTSASILAQLKQFTLDFPTYPSLDVLEYQVAQALN